MIAQLVEHYTIVTMTVPVPQTLRLCHGFADSVQARIFSGVNFTALSRVHSAYQTSYIRSRSLLELKALSFRFFILP